MNAILEQINSAGVKFVEFALPMFIQSVVLIVILLLVDFALKKKLRAVFRYWIWLLVLLKLILPTSLSSPLSLGYLIGDRLAYMDRDDTTSESKVKLGETSPVNVPPFINLRNIEADRFTPFVAAFVPNTKPITAPVISKVEPIPDEDLSASVAPLSWQGVVLLLWLAAVIAMLLLLLQRTIFVKGLLRHACPPNNLMSDALEYCRDCMGVKRKVSLKVSFNATSPAVCGLFRPVILLPQNLGPTLGSSHLRTVIMHELAHVKRGDLWINTVQVVLQVIYLYNPLLWLANAIIRRVREQAVDETVLVAMGPRAQQYPETLLSVARLAWQRPALSLRLIGVIESKSQLKERIKKMLERPVPKSAKLGIAGILIIIALGAFLLPMAKANNSAADTSAVSEQFKAEKEAEIKMLQEKIMQLEKHLQQLQKQVQQKKSQIAVVETKAKEQSDLIKKDKQKAEKDKAKSHTAEQEILVKEVVERIKQLEKLNNEQPQEAEEKDESDEQIEQLRLILEKIKQLEKANQEKQKTDVDEINVVVAPKPMPKPMPQPKPNPHPVPSVASVSPVLKVAPVPPAPPEIKLPPMPEVQPGFNLEKIHIITPKIKPPKETIQKISKLQAEMVALKQEISRLQKEFDRRKELDNISDEEAEEFDQKIEDLEDKHELLEERTEQLNNEMEAWGEQVRDKMEDWRQKFQVQMRHNFEQKNEEKLIHHEQQMRDREQQMKQQERQMQQFEQQMEQWAEQHEHQMEQWAEKFKKDMDVSLEGLENELDNFDVEVNVEVNEKADAKADANADVLLDSPKERKEKATFTKGPNIITAPLDPGRKIIVKNRIGSVNVISGQAGQCKCSITVKARAETVEQAREKAGPVKIEVDDDEKALNLVVVKTDNDEWNDINVDLDIQVPLGTDLVVITDIGSIKMYNLEGQIQGVTNVGDILVSNVHGNCKLITNVGKVVCEVPEEISADVEASTDVGSIKSELPLDVIRNFQKSQISGVLGKGEDKVVLRTKVGNITIRKASPPKPEEKL